MPKIKTRKAAAKRFKVTGGGKIKRAKAYKNHKLNSKSRKRKRNLRHGGYVSAAEEKNIKELLPYS
jgi:large subunit ribosomal protein L35